MACNDRSMGFRIKSVNNMIRRALDAKFSEEGMEEVCGMQGPLIEYIYEQSRSRDVFQRDLEKAFNIRRSTATVMLQNMEQKGFVVREPVEWDARLKKIVLTNKAIEQNNAIRRSIDVFNTYLEAGITQEEKEEFFRILDKVTENLTQKTYD